MDDAFSPLGDYGAVGNLETCALVNRDGAVEWCCLPYADSPSTFAAILDPEKGGHFTVTPAGEFETEQSYVERTNVLQTTFATASGTARLTDFMPVTEADSTEEPRIQGFYRRVEAVSGEVDLRVAFAPRFDYARAETTVEEVSVGATATGGGRQLTLDSPVPLSAADGTATAEFSLAADDGPQWFVLRYSMHTPTAADACTDLLSETVDYWRTWLHDEEDCPVRGRGHDAVVRSELTLKLLNYRETGALLAAPTTSLPEVPGGSRNWDYRYCWIRDGAMTVRALTNLGHGEMVTDYVHRFLNRSRQGDSAEVQPLFGLESFAPLEETELHHLRGYRDSTPVRVGNEAAEQQQLDVYGDLVLAVCQRLWLVDGVPDRDWRVVRETADYVREHWDERGAGIWELRGEPRHFVHSKVMCWAALDRAADLAEREDLDAPVEEWRDAAADIKERVIEEGYDEEREAFTQSFGGDNLDATALLIPLTGFLPPDDPRIENTIEAVRECLVTDDVLVYRYEDDGLPGEEGAFVICSFWLVNALVLSGRIEEAWDVFEGVLEYASPLGLLAEEVEPETGRLLGNYPQAFSHIGLINSVLYLREADTDWAAVEPLGAPTLRQERGVR